MKESNVTPAGESPCLSMSLMMAAMSLVALVGLVKIPLRIFIKGLFAARGTEVVGLPFILTLTRGRGRVNFHTAYRIFSHVNISFYVSIKVLLIVFIKRWLQSLSQRHLNLYLSRLPWLGPG
jgi:hypothetical protein